MHYLSVVIILFNTDLCKFAFSTYAFKNLFFLFLCSTFFVCSVLNSVLSLNFFNNCIVIVYIDTKLSVQVIVYIDTKGA